VGGFAARVLAASGGTPQIPLSGRIFQAMRVLDAVGTFGIAYVQDPDSPISRTLGRAETVDTVRFPRLTLMNRTGDCDDTTALVCSLLESVGVRTAIATTPGHIFMAFDTGEPPERRLPGRAGARGDTTRRLGLDTGGDHDPRAGLHGGLAISIRARAEERRGRKA